MTDELSEKQKQFGREYVKDRNTAAAYVRAGYAEKCAQSAGSRLLRDPRMDAFVKELGIKAADRNDVSVDEVIKNLRADRDAARAANQYGPAVRADELLGKYLAMFTDVNKNVVVDDMPAHEGITEMCTTNYVLNTQAQWHGMEMLRLLGDHIPSHNADCPPTQPALKIVKK